MEDILDQFMQVSMINQQSNDPRLKILSCTLKMMGVQLAYASKSMEGQTNAHFEEIIMSF
jgi:hypothetical protein